MNREERLTRLEESVKDIAKELGGHYWPDRAIGFTRYFNTDERIQRLDVAHRLLLDFLDIEEACTRARNFLRKKEKK